MNIQIQNLTYSRKNRDYIEALVPFRSTPSTSLPFELMRREPEYHPFKSWVHYGFLTDYEDLDGTWSAILNVTICNIDSIQVDDYNIRLQFEDGSLATFEIENDWYYEITIY